MAETRRLSWNDANGQVHKRKWASSRTSARDFFGPSEAKENGCAVFCLSVLLLPCLCMQGAAVHLCLPSPPRAPARPASPLPLYADAKGRDLEGGYLLFGGSGRAAASSFGAARTATAR